MKRFLIALAVLAVVFLAGFVPKYLENRTLQARVAEAQDRHRISALHSELGMILIEIQQRNFGIAKDRATRFFNDVRQAVSTVEDAALRKQLQPILERRDEIVSDLTAVNPEIEAKLRSMYVDFYRIAATPPNR